MITIDIDWKRLNNGYVISSEEDFSNKIQKIRSCPKVEKLEFRRSSSGNGYHIRCMCEGCDVCRLVFDSDLRFAMDQERSSYTQNVLWDSKVYGKHGKRLRMTAGEWRAV